MKRKSMLITAIVIVVMIITAVVPVFAALNQPLTLPANQKWKYAGTENHSTAYSRCGARCISAAPSSGGGSLSTIQCKVTNIYGAVVTASSYYVLTAGDADYTSIYLADGQLNTVELEFYFRGSTSAEALAYVSYVGTLIS